MGQIMLMRGHDTEQQMNALVYLVQRMNDKSLQLSTRVGALGGVSGAQANKLFAPPAPVPQTP